MAAIFSVKKEKKNLLGYLPALILVLAIVGLVHVSNATSASNSAGEKEILERALNRSITQCYALEGSYPPSLDYLTDNYGLTYDEEAYYIDYQYIGSNLRPDVTIIERQ